MIPNWSKLGLFAGGLEVLREPADIAAHERLGQADRNFAGRRLGRIDAMDARMAGLVAVYDEQPLLVVVKVEPVEDRRVVCRENDLLGVFLGQRDDLLQAAD